jgi:hypothetical protein
LRDQIDRLRKQQSGASWLNSLFNHKFAGSWKSPVVHIFKQIFFTYRYRKNLFQLNYVPHHNFFLQHHDHSFFFFAWTKRHQF